MNITNPYIAKTYEQIISDNPNEPNPSGGREVFESIAPVIEANDIYENMPCWKELQNRKNYIFQGYMGFR